MSSSFNIGQKVLNNGYKTGKMEEKHTNCINQATHVLPSQAKYFCQGGPWPHSPPTPKTPMSTTYPTYFQCPKQGGGVSTLDELSYMMHLIDTDSGQNKIIPRQIIRQSSYYIAFSFVPFCLWLLVTEKSTVYDFTHGIFSVNLLIWSHGGVQRFSI